MAGDDFTLYLCDYTKKILEEKYLGKLRYKSLNKFSFQKYKYYGSNYKYEIEERMSEGDENYNVFSLKNINEISNNLLEMGTPVSECEKEAYEDTKDIINWIEFIIKKYSNTYFYSEHLEENSIHLLLYTNID
jgi:hypothetical protein